MDKAELRDTLVSLAREAGLEVRTLDSERGREGDVALASGTCRVRGAVWVVVSSSDPLEAQLETLADALRTHASAFLEGRYLAPAVRERVSRSDLNLS